jgi:hypothetical protein
MFAVAYVHIILDISCTLNSAICSLASQYDQTEGHSHHQTLVHIQSEHMRRLDLIDVANIRIVRVCPSTSQQRIDAK